MLKLKFVSNLEKVFQDESFDAFKEIKKISALKGEKVSVQLVCALPVDETPNFPILFKPTFEGKLMKYASVRRVMSVPATRPANVNVDEDFLRTTPGLFPDVLMPLQYSGRVVLAPRSLTSLWIDFEIPSDADVADSGEISVTFTSVKTHERTPDISISASVSVEIIDAVLPEQKLLFTQWFHADCLANYYKVEKWSDEHFRIIENFAKTAKKNGINMLLTPLISPPLDNKFDTRDLQLADVIKTDDGYEFSWDKLARWIDICDRVGIKYFEIGHLFTQGGAAYATKVMGTVGNEYKRIFPKDTPCDDPEYTTFLRAMLKSFLDFMKARGDDTRCYFHISDEPSDKQLETYLKAKNSVADLLEGYPIMDALSHYEFYERGVVKKPVVILHCLSDFLNHGVPGLWAYNCCGPEVGYSNRFMGMSLSRNRSISLLLYKYDIEGFLHWGYNFYNNSGSSDPINPFLDTSSGDFFPSGDAFSVYPGDNGEPYESTRLVTFFEGIQDISVMRLCEQLYSKEEVIATIEKEIGKEIRTNTYINAASDMHRVRGVLNSMIKAKISK